MGTSSGRRVRNTALRGTPFIWSLGPVERGYLYVDEHFMGLAERVRLTALPDYPKPGDKAGFVEVSTWLGERAWGRLSEWETISARRAQWRLKIAGPVPWSYPELVLEEGLGTPTGDGHLSVRSDWDIVEEGFRPWSVKPSSPRPDVRLFRQGYGRAPGASEDA